MVFCQFCITLLELVEVNFSAAVLDLIYQCEGQQCGYDAQVKKYRPV